MPASQPLLPAGWQVLLADLSLILFIATAGAVSVQPAIREAYMNPTDDPEQVFSSLTTGEDIADWLADYAPDPREQLLITIEHREGEFAIALKRARKLEIAAVTAGQAPIITIRQGDQNKTTALFAFNRPSPSDVPPRTASLARRLQ